MGHFHLHSIIIEIAHLHLLNTEHKERNVWRHFNLREEEKRTGGRGVGGKPGNEVIWTVWKMTSGKPRQVTRPLLAELESGWFLWHFLGSLHYMPDPSRAGAHRGTRWEFLGVTMWTLSSPFFFLLNSQCYIFQGHSLSLQCKRYLGR